MCACGGGALYSVNEDGAYPGASMYGLRSNGKPAELAVADGRGARLEQSAYLFEGAVPI